MTAPAPAAVRCAGKGRHAATRALASPIRATKEPAVRAMGSRANLLGAAACGAGKVGENGHRVFRPETGRLLPTIE